MIAFNTIHAEITWDLSDDGTLTISGTGDMKDKPWSSQREKIKKVIIKNGVTNICYSAFRGYSNLASITIPESVTSIGSEAFYDCSHLTSVAIPNSVTSIGSHTFLGCSELTSVNIPNSVTTIGDFTFYECSSLTSITIPSSVMSIGDYAFFGCSSIKEIYSWNTLPPVCRYSHSGTAYDYYNFEGVSTMHAKVFVPKGSSDAYKYAPGWMNFLNIYEMEDSPVLPEAKPITISDSKPTVTNGYYKEKSITYVREDNAISKDNYASFCLPFAVDPADAQFKAVYLPVGLALYNTEKNSLRIGFYKSDEIIPAGTPFIAQLAVDNKIEIKNAMPVNYDSNSAITKKVIRTFNYSDMGGLMSGNNDYAINISGTYKKESPAKAYAFNTDGSIGLTASVAPFRAYVAIAKNNTNAKIITSFDEDTEATGIMELRMTNDKQPIYNLNGQRINKSNAQKGVYIKNGKKYAN